MSKKNHEETIAVRHFFESSQFNEHNIVPFLSSSFKYDNSQEAQQLFLGNQVGYTYSRTSNPTVTSFQMAVAKLEGAECGQATSTGMAAINVTFMGLLKANDHLVVSKSLFGTTIGLINFLPRFGIDVSYVSLNDLEEWKGAIKKNTKMFFLETPSNPLCETVDLRALSEIAHRNNIIVAVDNTFCSPAIQKPIELGVDLSIQSATKSIDGQGRVFGGVVSGPQKMINEITSYVRTSGQVLSPFNAWVLCNGIETLFVRMEKQSANALEIAQWLSQHSKVEKVYYPGLTSHPQYDLIKTQQKSGGIIISFEIQGNQESAWKVIDNASLFSRTGNLGDAKSTITHPYTTTHCKVSPQMKEESGIKKNLIRLSIGLEHPEDLKNDLEEVFKLI